MAAPALYLKPVSGLANRLRTIASARVEARRLGRPLQVLWERDAALNCDYQDLLLPPEDFRVHDYCRGVPDRLLPAVRALWPTSRRQAGSAPHAWLRRCLAPQLPARQQWISEDLAARFPPFPPSTDYPQHEAATQRAIAEALAPADPASAMFVSSCWKIGEAGADYGFVRPVPAIAQAVAAQRATLAGCIGVHIRQGDHAEAIAHSPVSAFLEAMQARLAQAPGTRFFVATDSLAAWQHLEAALGERVLRYAHSNADRNSVAGIQSALAELLMLSLTTEIWGSHMSSFSYVPGEIGGLRVRAIRTGATAGRPPGDAGLGSPAGGSAAS